MPSRNIHYILLSSLAKKSIDIYGRSENIRSYTDGKNHNLRVIVENYQSAKTLT